MSLSMKTLCVSIASRDSNSCRKIKLSPERRDGGMIGSGARSGQQGPPKQPGVHQAGVRAAVIAAASAGVLETELGVERQSPGIVLGDLEGVACDAERAGPGAQVLEDGAPRAPPARARAHAPPHHRARP